MRRRTSLTTSTRSAAVALPPDEAWERLVAAGGRSRWYADAAPFVLRGAIDRLVGGAGRRWPVPTRRLLQTGDRAGFWTVVDCDHDRRHLELQAQVRSPGTVVLTAAVAADGPDAGSRVDLAVTFTPRGLLGAGYLLADLPARELVVELTQRAAVEQVRSEP